MKFDPLNARLAYLALLLESSGALRALFWLPVSGLAARRPATASEAAAATAAAAAAVAGAADA